jgi:hypothetical protein
MSNNLQHLDDIEIPDIEITSGWAVSEVETIDDCDDAFAFLSAATAHIEYQIEMDLTKPMSMQDPTWAAKARYALKMKKAALGIVANKRSAISKKLKADRQREHDRYLLEFIKKAVPAIQFAEWIRASGVDRQEEFDTAV